MEFNEGKLNFNRAIFGNGDVSFEGSQVKGEKVLFKKSEFGKGMVDFQGIEYDEAELIFDYANFGEGEISFHNGRCKLLSLKSCHI
ncbi:MAG: hypothetical protein ACOCUL_02350 [Bacteroidota bacterium]